MSGREVAADPAVARRRRAKLSFLLRVAVSAALIVFLVRKAGVGSISRTVGSAAPGWLVAGFALGILAAGMQAYQWKGLLGAMGIRRHYLSTLRLDTAARGFDAALPTSIGGDVVRATLASPTPSQRLPAAVSVVLRRLLQLPGLICVIVAGLILSRSLDYAGRVRPFALACVGAGLALMALVGLAARSKTVRRIPVPAAVRRLSAEWTMARRQTVTGHPFLLAAGRGLLFWIVVVLSQVCFIHAVGIRVPFGYSMMVIATVNALSMLPISFGGYGLREGTFSAFLTAGGHATTAQGAAVGALLSIQTFAFGVVGGLVYLTLRRQAHQAASRPESVSAVGGVA